MFETMRAAVTRWRAQLEVNLALLHAGILDQDGWWHAQRATFEQMERLDEGTYLAICTSGFGMDKDAARTHRMMARASLAGSAR